MNNDSRAAAAPPNRDFKTVGLLALALAGPAAAHGQGVPQFALRFDGDDFVIFAEDGRADIGGPFSIEAWVKPSALDAPWQAFVTKGEAWGLVRYANTGQVAFVTREAGTGNANHLVSPDPLAVDTWYHLAATWDGAVKRLLVDGAEVANREWAGPLAANDFELVFGGNAEQAGRGFKGDLETVRLWSRARLAEEVDASKANRLRGSEVGLLGEWRFNEGAGAVAGDSSVNGLDGALATLSTGPVWVAGRLFFDPPPGEHALQFRADGEGVSLDAESPFDFGPAMSLETWIWIDALPDPAAATPVIHKGADAWALLIGEGGELVFRTYHASAADDLVSASPLETGRWYHVAATWDGTSKRLYTFDPSDGSSRAEESGSASGDIDANDADVVFGDDAAGGGPFFRGRLDEVRLWDAPLPADWILQNLDREVSGNEPHLAGAWSFNEGSGPAAEDGAAVSPVDGTLDNMDDTNRVSGVVLGDPQPPQNALFFDGVDDFIAVPHDPGLDFGSFTIEAWVRPGGSGFRNILMKGDLGYGLALDENDFLRFWDGPHAENTAASHAPVEPGVWQHVAVAVDTAAGTTSFYIGGRPAGTVGVAIVNNNSGPLIIGKQGSAVDANYYEGYLDELRLWDYARPASQIRALANSTVPAGALGLAAHWTFDEGAGAVLGDSTDNGFDGALNNMSDASWFLGRRAAPPIDVTPGEITLAPNPQARGLWVGTVYLNRVNEVQTATPRSDGAVTPTADTATARILFHVDSAGTVRLLKHVTLLSAAEEHAGGPVEEEDLPEDYERRVVLVTDDLLIPQFEGVVIRRGKLVGRRVGTAAYDFVGTELPFIGGIGEGHACHGVLDLPADHPTNPFRHKFHPDHAAGRPVTRTLSLQFPVPGPEDPQPEPGFGTDQVLGTYEEVITGLHKVPLHLAGGLTLTRVSEVGVLNE